MATAALLVKNWMPSLPPLAQDADQGTERKTLVGAMLGRVILDRRTLDRAAVVRGKPVHLTVVPAKVVRRIVVRGTRDLRNVDRETLVRHDVVQKIVMENRGMPARRRVVVTVGICLQGRRTEVLGRKVVMSVRRDIGVRPVRRSMVRAVHMLMAAVHIRKPATQVRRRVDSRVVMAGLAVIAAVG